MSKDIQIIITVSDRAAEQLAGLTEFFEEKLVEATAETLDVPADFTTMNASYRGVVDDVPASALPGGFEYETGDRG